MRHIRPFYQFFNQAVCPGIDSFRHMGYIWRNTIAYGSYLTCLAKKNTEIQQGTIRMSPRTINDTTPHDLLEGLRIFGADISSARRARRMKQESLAQRMNVSRKTVSRMEAGDPGVSMLTYATAFWVMRLESNLLDCLAPGNDPVQLKEGRLNLPRRIRNRHSPSASGNRSTSPQTGTITVDHNGMDF